jgi:ethanolamine utilization protein EutA
MQEVIKSVGIDIGTSTTQLIFSTITIENMAAGYHVPKIEIVATDVTYRSDIYFTPLIDNQTIDAAKVKSIIMDEYRKAGKDPEDLQTGAVIITGETARKENANEVLSALSDMAGEFVVATAGPDLESVLAAKGAGVDKKSEEEKNTIVNIDIGGGTSNLAAFKRGTLVGTSCLDIGGRLIKIENGKISYIYEKIAKLASAHGIDIKVGDPADKTKLERICKVMAKHLAMSAGLLQRDAEHMSLYTNDGTPLPDDVAIEGIAYSGGVADVVYHPDDQADPFRYGDIGPMLAKAINDSQDFKAVKRYDVLETIRATVVGAGTHTTDVSGSTITFDRGTLPIKNIPVIKITEEQEKQLNKLGDIIKEKQEVFESGDTGEITAIGLAAHDFRHFDDVQELADAILKGVDPNDKRPLIIVLENDIAKVLGNSIKLRLNGRRQLVCIDSVYVHDGDYIDIGEPVAGGRVVPVVTKTLIFNR